MQKRSGGRAHDRKAKGRPKPVAGAPGRSTSILPPSHVVGVGGSAGSLEPLEQFFQALRPDTTMSFVVVTHRDPREKGMMAEILAQFTSMPVREALEGARLERGVVYVAPSSKHLQILGGRIELLDRPPGAPGRTPIDSLFRAIAADCRDRSVGVVLSGMGADGTAGLTAIKEALGVGLVQDPATSAYDAMPRSAIAAGLADIIDAPGKLARRLDEIAQYSARPRRSRPAPADGVDATSLSGVLAAVRARTGHDFTQYKKSTLSRRIQRRMGLGRVPDLPRYVEMLARDPSEIDRLKGDLLIGATRFFRDPEVFDALTELALPELFRDRTAERPLRVWVAGCSTGEEAYSVAIAIRERWELHRRAEPLHIQIYATDLDQTAIDHARRGVYARAIASDVSPERLARFFVADEAGYRVRKQIREMVVFATQNLVSDPPFTKLDVLTCRNVLIYMEPELQRKILSLFLYALAPGGILVLGTSESVSGFEEGFRPVSGDLKVFQRSGAAPALVSGLVTGVPFHPGRTRRAEQHLDAPPGPSSRRALLPEIVERAVVQHVAPPVVVVDVDGNLLFASQRTGRYLEPPPGKATINVFAMAREGLGLPLRTAVRKALAKGVKVTARSVRFQTSGREAEVNLSVWPLDDVDAPRRAMIAFVDVEERRSLVREEGTSKRGPSAKRVALELRQAKAQLGALTIEMSRSDEALRGVNEALQSANEELQSTNEELQSTNEELTTSKEEMQSMNEELLTLNAELQTMNEQLATTNDDMRNLLNSSQIPTLFLDNDLRLKRYTAQATPIARLIPTDVGRPITDIAWSLRYETLTRDVKEVLDTLTFKEAEVVTVDGATYRMRIHPYRTIDDIIDGVVITFTDVSAYKREAERDRQRLIEVAVNEWPGIAYVEDVLSRRAVAISAATSTILGHPRAVLEAAKGEFWTSLRPAKHRRSVDETRKAGAASRIVSIPHADGNVGRYREREVVMASAADGRVTHVLHTFRRLRRASEAGDT